MYTEKQPEHAAKTEKFSKKKIETKNRLASEIRKCPKVRESSPVAARDLQRMNATV